MAEKNAHIKYRRKATSTGDALGISCWFISLYTRQHSVSDLVNITTTAFISQAFAGTHVRLDMVQESSYIFI